MSGEGYVTDGTGKLDAHLRRQAEATTEATNKLFEVGAYTQGAALLRSMGMQEHIIYEVARGFAAERGEEEDFMEDLYGDLLRDPS